MKNSCIHCGRCTEVCPFLQKYGLDLAGLQARPELAYHCFLCGRCGEVCPVHLDGTEIVLDMRREQVRQKNGRVTESGYGMLMWEKEKYKFRRDKMRGATSVLFPGCNFPAFYPKTMAYLEKLLWEQAHIGTLYDCCGKPVSELGLEGDKGIGKLEQALQQAGVRELILLCPNCYGYLKDKISIPQVTIYEKLAQLGLGKKVDGDRAVFLPCPDRKEQVMLRDISFFTGRLTAIEGVNCCGLGGCASGKEPEIAAGFAKALREKEPGETAVYCASCAGNLARQGMDVHHLLVDLLGTGEVPETGLKTVWNRAKQRLLP